MLRLLEHGRSTDQIAQELHLSRETVRNHIRHILQALGVHSRLEAVAVARQEHLAGDRRLRPLAQGRSTQAALAGRSFCRLVLIARRRWLSRAQAQGSTSL